jgi:hypothetical protein
MKRILAIIFTSTFMIFCNSPDVNEADQLWLPIIKELEMVLIADIPDSLKAVEIDKIFQNYQINLEDYEKYYRQNIEKRQLENIAFLKEIEATLGAEMKEELNRQRQEAEAEKKPRSSK